MPHPHRFAALVLATLLPALGARAAVPDLDMRETCKSAGVDGGRGADQSRSNDACLRDENAARRELDGQWNRIPVAVQRSCLDEVKIGGSPSYVELLTCAQMQQWSKEGPNPTAPGQGSAPGSAPVSRP